MSSISLDKSPVKTIYAQGPDGSVVWSYNDTMTLSDGMVDVLFDLLLMGGGYYRAEVPELGWTKFKTVQEAMERNSQVALRVMQGLGMSGIIRRQDGTEEAFSGAQS